MYPVGGISASIYANRLRAEGMGSNDQAVPFCHQDYEALRQQCVESGCLFEDPYFPAEASSLGFKELAPHSSKTRGVEWQRPTVRTPQHKADQLRILRFGESVHLNTDTLVVFPVSWTSVSQSFIGSATFTRHSRAASDLPTPEANGRASAYVHAFARSPFKPWLG